MATAQDLGDLLGGGGATESDQPSAKEIDTQSTPALDQEIADRLQGIFSELDELSGIDVSVRSGIVTLDGVASSTAASDRATQLAEQIADVVDVVNETSVDSSLRTRFDSTLHRWKSNLRAMVLALPAFTIAVLLFGAFWWLGRWVSSRQQWFRKITPNGFIANLVAGACRIMISLLGVVLALSLLDQTSIIGTVLGAAGIVGLAVGFAVRDTVENYIASILLSLRQPFEARDLVVINGNEGQVARLTSRATILISPEGNHVRIPNAEVYKATIINYTRNPYRRFEFVVGVDTDLVLQPAQDLAVETVQRVSGVLAEPQALVLIDQLGDSNVSLNVICWIDQRSSDLRKVRSEAIRQVKRAFDEAGIVMPEPIYRLKITSGAMTSPSVQGQSERSGNEASSTESTATPSFSEGKQGITHRTNFGQIHSLDGIPEAQDECADTSNDTSVEATLAMELETDTSENLLASDTPKE